MIRLCRLSSAHLYSAMVVALAFVAGVLLSSCSSNGKQWNPDDYTVKSGDTLYSVAWRYELDPEAFAAWNGVTTSKFIKPGQRLHTRKPANFDASRAAAADRAVAYAPDSSKSASVYVSYSNKMSVKAVKGDTLYGLSKRHGVSVDKLVQLNQLKKPYVIQPGQTIFLKPLKSSTQTTVSTKSPSQKPGSQKPGSQAQSISWPKTVSWQRPAKGKIVKKFDRRRNDAKGIDIAGTKGNAIVASADGKVVYSGGGLISYGNLIIIKHNKMFLSAYAYNRKLLVKEGDIVKAGQQIAEMGHKDKLSPRLHFEIRKNGKPVDPLKYLPWQ